MSLDESDAISNLIEFGMLDVGENEVICWANGKTYKAKIIIEEVEDE